MTIHVRALANFLRSSCVGLSQFFKRVFTLCWVCWHSFQIGMSQLWAFNRVYATFKPCCFNFLTALSQLFSRVCTTSRNCTQLSNRVYTTFKEGLHNFQRGFTQLSNRVYKTFKLGLYIFQRGFTQLSNRVYTTFKQGLHNFQTRFIHLSKRVYTTFKQGLHNFQTGFTQLSN